jgi:hypothetical protein
MESATQALRENELFQALQGPDLEKVAASSQRLALAGGDVILREGELGDELYVILSGEVQVYVHDKDDQEVVLDRWRQPKHFGEQALLPGGNRRRNANVRALTSSWEGPPGFTAKAAKSVSWSSSLVGQAGWTPVIVSREFQVVPDVRTFRFLSCGGDFQPAQPGQHVLVQSRAYRRQLGTASLHHFVQRWGDRFP